MRYISKHPRLGIFDYNGNLRYQFEQGELIVGTPFDDGNEIDATTQTPFGNTLQRVFDTGLVAADELLNKVGLGYLTSSYQYRNFFRAPYQTIPYTTSHEGWYQIIQGSFLISDVIYNPGELVFLPQGFQITQNMVLTTGNAYVAAFLPQELWSEQCVWDADAEFKKNVLLVGDESNDYYLYSRGYKPKNSLDPNSSDYVGWIRK